MKPPTTSPAIFSNVFAGCICALMTVIAGISYATLIFSGTGENYLQLGIVSAIISATVIGLVVALRSSSPLSIAGPDANISAIIALIAAATVAQSAGRTQSLFTMLWFSLAASTLLTGIFLFFVGRYRLGHWIRYIPYPVVGGFLAGTGLILARGSFKVMCGVGFSLKTLPTLAAGPALIHWLPGLFFALLMLVVLRRFHHFLVMPCMLIGAIIVCHIILFTLRISPHQATQDGWLLSAFPADVFMRTLGALQPGALDLSALLPNAANIAALMIVAAIVILLNAASIELTTLRDVELDRELKAAGIANIIAAPLGALAGCTALSRTILNFKAGATNRIAGVSAAVLCGILLLFGAQVFSLFPRVVLGGLLLYLGLSLLLEWVWDGFSKLSRFDYLLVWAIIIVIALYGFLAGVGSGLVIACMLFVVNYSRSGAIRQAFTRANCHSNVERSFLQQNLLHEQGDAIYIVKLQGYIFFGSAYPLLVHFQDKLAAAAVVPVRYIILDFAGVTGLDSSSILSFSKLLQGARLKRVTVLFVNLKEDVRNLLEQGRCAAALSAQVDGHASCGIVFPDLDYALGWCEDKIIAAAGAAEAEKTNTFKDYFSGLFGRPDLLPRLMGYLERLKVDAGFVLFKQGAPSENLYFVESGEVAALLEIPGVAARKRLRSMGAGTVIGEMGLYLGGLRSATIVAEKESVLFRLSETAFKAIEEKELDLAAALHRFFVSVLANRLMHTNEEVAFLMR
ncbi:MAG: SulP family inorganic anion transporter [Chitinivibrionales bacterium]|nr:SulP family inorganic anion transporter [Chitinivibrionales bacterium]